MIRRLGSLLTVAVATLLACAGAVLAQTTAPVPPRPAAEDVVPGRYIVVLRDDIVQASSAQVASEQARRHGLEVTQTY
jgi:hypothetical protein